MGFRTITPSAGENKNFTFGGKNTYTPQNVQQTQQQQGGGGGLLQGLLGAGKSVANFLYPQGTKAVTEALPGGSAPIGSKEFFNPQEKTTGFPRVVGEAASVLPGLSGARQALTSTGTLPGAAREAVSDITLSGIMSLIGGTKSVQAVSKTLKEGIPAFLVKLGLGDSGKAATKAFKKSALGTGKTVAEEVVDRNLVGSAKKLIKKSDTVLKSLEDRVMEQLGKIPVTEITDLVPGKPITPAGPGGRRSFVTGAKEEIPQALNNVQQFISDTVNDASKKVAQEGGVIKTSQLKSIKKEVEDILNLQLKKAGKFGWESVLQLKRNADKVAKGEVAQDLGSITKKTASAIADTIRERLSTDPEIIKYAPEIAQLIKEEQFWLRLGEVSAKAGTKTANLNTLTKVLAGSTVGGIGGGLPGGIIGGTAALVGSTPLGATALGNLFKRGATAAGSSIPITARTALNQLMNLSQNNQQENQLQ